MWFKRNCISADIPYNGDQKTLLRFLLNIKLKYQNYILSEQYTGQNFFRAFRIQSFQYFINST